jgi:conjugal transfer pilus assembly protein TraU
MHAKLHRAAVALDMSTRSAMCGPRVQPILRKGSYKTQMLYPIPTTQSAPFYGESTALWSAGKEYPVRGEDFLYLIWRRRTCCAF